MSGRAHLIAEISKFLRDQLSNGVLSRLTNGKNAGDHTQLERYQVGILKDVIGKVNSILKRYSISPMPEFDDLMENNIVYVDLIEGELHYKFSNALGDSPNAIEYKGSITTSELPALASVVVPLESGLIQPLCIDILTILHQRGHIKFSIEDLGALNKLSVLKTVLHERDNQFEGWLFKIDKLAKLYFKREFNLKHIAQAIADINKAHPADQLSDDQLKEKIKERRHQYIDERYKEIKQFEAVYLAVFKLYYRLARQMFCLQQFATIENPEELVSKAPTHLEGLQMQNQTAEKSDINQLEWECNAFEKALTQLIDYIEGRAQQPDFATLLANLEPNKSQNLAPLMQRFDAEVKRLAQSRVSLDSIRRQAQIAAKSGDKAELRVQLQAANDQLVAIQAIESALTKEIRRYIESLHKQIKQRSAVREVIERNVRPTLLVMPQLMQLKQLAEFMESKQDEVTEFDRLKECVNNLVVAFQAQNGWKENGWGVLSDKIEKKANSLQAKLQHYADIYFAHRKTIDNAAVSFEALVKWSEYVNIKCAELPVQLNKMSNMWSDMPAQFATHWRKPYEDVRREAKLNVVAAFMRRHWWKMLLGGVILAAVAAPVALLVLGLSAAVVAGVTVAAFFIGIAAGFGVSKGIDRCGSADELVDVGDEALRRSSSADALAVMRRESDVVIEMRKISPKTADRSIVAAKKSYNPFDDAGEVEAAGVGLPSPSRSTNPFA